MTPGPAPKPPGQRRNRRAVVGQTTLDTTQEQRVQAIALPNRYDGMDWHPAAVEWAQAISDSPMLAEFIKSDAPGLLILAEMIHAFWSIDWNQKGGARLKIELAAEVRRQQANYGLSPLDRWRLKWQIEQGDKASESTARRRQAAKGGAKVKDPRELTQ